MVLVGVRSEEVRRRCSSSVECLDKTSEAQRGRGIIGLLGKYALEEEIEEELDMPGWTEELVERMTALYDADVEVIRAMPCVSLIAP